MTVTRLKQSACQTAAGRALWNHVAHDPLAELLAGETYPKNLYEKIKKDQLNNARQVSGVILAVRTLWFELKLELAIKSFGGRAQVVLLGSGMDTRVYRLECLMESDVYEIDFPKVMQIKGKLLQEAMGLINEPIMIAKTLKRIAADIREEIWFKKLLESGFIPEKSTVWILEGIIYYLLPSLGFSDVKLSQIGDPDAEYSLLHDPQNLFNKLRHLPRSIQNDPDDGTPWLYLVQASGSPNQTISRNYSP